jgi:hypothetical protein
LCGSIPATTRVSVKELAQVESGYVSLACSGTHPTTLGALQPPL